MGNGLLSIAQAIGYTTAIEGRGWGVRSRLLGVGLPVPYRVTYTQ